MTSKKCDNCIHNSLCKHKEEYVKALKDFQEINYNYPITIEISCYQYLKDSTYYHFSENVKKSYVSTSTNPCEGCSIYEEIKKSKVVINDACSFCSKNPYKMGGKK